MKTIKGNLLDMFDNGDFGIIIQGCNCQTVMGAGLAGQIAGRYPEVILADKLYDYKSKFDKLSHFSIATIRRKNNSIGVIVNLYTQFMPGPDLYEEALLLGMKRIVNNFLMKFPNSKIGIPEIGCGIAGGDWTTIGPKIEQILSSFDVTHVEYEFKNKKDGTDQD